jgi:hypothetical protein
MLTYADVLQATTPPPPTHLASSGAWRSLSASGQHASPPSVADSVADAVADAVAVAVADASVASVPVSSATEATPPALLASSGAWQRSTHADSGCYEGDFNHDDRQSM